MHDNYAPKCYAWMTVSDRVDSERWNNDEGVTEEEWEENKRDVYFLKIVILIFIF